MSSSNSSGKIQIDLLKHEREVLAMMPAVTTVTGYSTVDRTAPVSFLRNKIRELLLKNPWLTGRLESKTDTCDLIVCFKDISTEHETVLESIVDEHFTYEDNFKLDASCEYESLVSQFQRFHVKSGKKCVDENEQLFKVSVLNIRDMNKIFLVFSLSHILADGYTFYKLQNMMDR